MVWFHFLFMPFKFCFCLIIIVKPLLADTDSFGKLQHKCPDCGSNDVENKLWSEILKSEVHKNQFTSHIYIKCIFTVFTMTVNVKL